MQITSSLYSRLPRKTTVNGRRINRERLRRKLAIASFVSAPRLMQGDKLIKVAIR